MGICHLKTASSQIEGYKTLHIISVGKLQEIRQIGRHKRGWEYGIRISLRDLEGQEGEKKLPGNNGH